MDEHTTSSLDLDTPNLSSSTLLDFSPSYFSSTEKFMRCFDPIVSLEETDMNPHPLDDYQEFFDNRLIQAFENLYQGCTVFTDLLVQLWLPVITHGELVLTTVNKSFIINSSANTNLLNYREVSKNYQFAADYDSTR
ncbi:unnamed protein product [Lactuca virosa]|uniref:Uncharacterized protein n=1 Tax=Lactuca virosa TaxID=75947 RepID=A0AAU9M9T2_9ASTR|nr:unnamed protein product [Lactuca virosa]